MAGLRVSASQPPTLKLPPLSRFNESLGLPAVIPNRASPYRLGPSPQTLRASHARWALLHQPPPPGRWPGRCPSPAKVSAACSPPQPSRLASLA